MSRQSFEASKEPWLAVLLSTIFPGIGHLYAGKTVKGVLIVAIALFLLGFAGWSVLSPTGSFRIAIQLTLAYAILTLASYFDAYRSTKNSNSTEFEQRRRTEKDPWLAAFLSNVIPGLGQLYGRQWIMGLLFFVLSIFASALSKASPVILLGSAALLAFCLYHAYISTPTEKNKSKGLITTVCLAIIAAQIVSGSSALAIHKFVAEARFIPSESMSPTLQIDDRLIVNKLNYRNNNPQRGDIIVYSPPEAAQNMLGTDVALIHRIIGLPNEAVEVRDGSVYINSEALAEPYIAENPLYQWGPEVIPEAAYLVLGDKRNSSADSHVFGFVQRDLIIGKATKLFWPPSRIGPL